MHRSGGLAAILILTLAGASAAAEWSVDRWDQTVYYRYSFTAAAAAGVLRITAADEYEAFLNGASVGTGRDWATPEEHAVSLASGANHLAVRVRHLGQRAGSGLRVELAAGEQRWVSATSGLNEVWLWSAAAPPGTAWLTADLSRNADWHPVQEGSLDRSGIGLTADTLGAEVIAGFAGGVEAGAPEGGLQLRSVRGENLALARPANRPEVFDGRPTTVWTINPGDLNTTAGVDLLQRRLLAGVRVLTAGRTATEFAENTMRGYAVQVSNDGFQWSEVGVLHGIDHYEQTRVFFRPLFARHVRVVVAEVDPLRRSRVAEIQVHGEGIAPAGVFLSEPLDLGTPTPKNFGLASWDADRPKGTDLSLQFRSADDTSAWSPWSEPARGGQVALPVPEPRRLLQYRVNLATEFEDVSPRLRALRVEHSGDIPVSSARGHVVPNDAVLGRDTLFTYTLDLRFAAADLGVDRVLIATPSRVELDAVDLPAGAQLAGAAALGDSLELRFTAPLRTSGSLRVRFRARLLTNQFAFAAQLLAPGVPDAVNAAEETTADAATGAARSWSVRASDVTGDILAQVRANPPVISPNGDGVNDDTVIEFTLARVSAPQTVEIRVLGLDGGVVRDLDPGPLSGGQYLRPPAGRDPARSPAYWDGRDRAGALVAPGLYVVMVRARLGRGDETRLRTVAVVY